jgi:prepilin-type processing-associated H-X9-DG protein
MRDSIVQSGEDRHVMYCPTADWQDVDSLWWYSGQPANNFGYSVTGYFWMMKRIDGSFPVLNSTAAYVDNIAFDRVLRRDPASTELASDATLSQNGSFVGIKGGWSGSHGTSHTHNDNRPEGGNMLYLDGHAEWHDFADMQIRGSSGTVDFWY